MTVVIAVLKKKMTFCKHVKKGQENIEIPLFDSHWYGALQNLPRHADELRVPNDTVPSLRTYTLRQYFNVLPLLIPDR